MAGTNDQVAKEITIAALQAGILNTSQETFEKQVAKIVTAYKQIRAAVGERAVEGS